MNIIHISFAGPFYRMTKGRIVWHFEDHKFCGPMRCDAKGDPYNDGMFPDKSHFWDLYAKWVKGGKQADEKGNCIIPGS